jgi:hypothetical protein
MIISHTVMCRYRILHAHTPVRTCTVTYQACLRPGAVFLDEAEYTRQSHITLDSRWITLLLPQTSESATIQLDYNPDTMFQPLGNSTVLPAAEWHPEPQTRGTFTILSSCLITMSLCIWTSLHLNLPEHKKEHLQKYRKLGWMILGLIAPEIVVWNAWSQRKTMKKVSKLMQEKGFMPVKLKPWARVCGSATKAWQWTLTCLLLRAGDLPELAEPTPYRQYNGRIHPWTDVHSWLVVMGGMSFEDSAEEDQQFMPQNRQRANITIEGFEYMLKMRDHLIPDISREYIQDKSKSDSLAKLLTCWQAGYFCIQCVFRLSQQLSVTLLELNVLAHAVCALALFAIWSNKPRDVCEPTLIVGEEAMNICALLCLHVVKANPKYFHGYAIVGTPKYPDRSLEILGPTSFTLHHVRSQEVYYGVVYWGPYDGLCSMKVLGTYWLLDRAPMPRHTDFIVTLDARDLRRLQRVSTFIQREKRRFPEPTCIHSDDTPDVRSCHSIDRTTNWSLDVNDVSFFAFQEGISAFKVSRFVWGVVGMTFAGTCYGGLHLVAWKTPFASRAEALLWRAASVNIMATGPFYAFITACFRPFIDAYMRIPRSIYWRYGPRSGRSPSDTYLNIIIDKVLTLMTFVPESMASFFVILILWYIFCRVFIIVESFIMLAHIPEQSLQVPTWSAYIPHIV